MDINDLVARIRANSTREDWRGWCQSLVWNTITVCGVPESEMVTYPSARAAYEASTIMSIDHAAAPAGAIHYWRLPVDDGHVAVALGDGMCLMASGICGGDGIGVIGVEEYTTRAGNQYLGWAHTNGANKNIQPAFARAEKGGVLMALTDQEQKRLLAKIDLISYALDKIILPALARVDRGNYANQQANAKVENALAEFKQKLDAIN